MIITERNSRQIWNEKHCKSAYLIKLRKVSALSIVKVDIRNPQSRVVKNAYRNKFLKLY